MESVFTRNKLLFLQLITALLLWRASVISGLTCRCNFVDSSCVNSMCTVTSVFGSCEIYYQSNQLFQACTNSFVSCPQQLLGELIYNPQSTITHRYCCRSSDLCNTVQNLEEEILERGLSIPWQSTQQSVTPTSTSGSSSSIPTTTNIITTTASTTTTTTSTTASASTTTVCSTCGPLVDSHSATFTFKSSQTSPTVTSNSSIIEPTVQQSGKQSAGPPTYAVAVIVSLAVLLVVFVLVILVVIFLHYYPRHVVGAMSVESEETPTCTLSTECGDLDDHIYKNGFEGTTSGSGAGLPLLIQRSIAAQVTLKGVIGKGRFGEVRRGTYKGDAVAVKIFHTKEEASWNHEVDIYQTCLIRHPNILRFIAADNKDVGNSTQLWLITEFCDRGSLYDVLQEEPLSEDRVLTLLFTAASGLAHLHSDIIGTEGKPAIAHRDIKTRNILVKADYSCCLADLGLSLRYYRDTDKVEEPPTKRVGTRRYLSPEILNDSMNMSNFDCFKRSDMYSFGLVMWETARRGICADTYEDYQLPYFDLVNPDPSFEDMKKCVAIDKKRPTIPNRWSQSEVFHSLAQLMEQCWHNDGEARLTALRVKKNLSNIEKNRGKKEPLTETS